MKSTTARWVAGIFVFVAACGLAQEAPKVDKAQQEKLAESLKKACVNGKYAMLLRQIHAPKDAETYKDFADLGNQEEPEWAGAKDVPEGYYVYAAPYWYIWRDLASKGTPKRSWGPEQTIGDPDTVGPGDISTAWASKTPDGQDEWLLLEYAEPVLPSSILVHETHNPGALVRVTVFDLEGKETEVWAGKDPTPTVNGWGIGVIEAKVDFKVNRVKLYLDSKAVPGWNEIDAVGLMDVNGKTHWATAAEASSTYAQEEGVRLDQLPQRVKELEREVRQLKRKVSQLEKTLEELKKKP
jgi:hypothetical protein